MNNNQFNGLTKMLSHAIDAYEDMLYQLEHQKPKQKRARDFSKVKDFLFKRVF